jgi:hypothetical protein
MGRLWGWIRRRRVLAAFTAGALLTLGALAVVGYLVLADQRRSAQVLAAALTRALKREVEIERVITLGPSRVVLRGLRLPGERGWPADVKAESVEVSGPLLAAARGEAAPVRILVTQPTIAAGGGGATGAAALEGLRQGLASLLGNAALLDVAISGGVLEVPGPPTEAVTFDATLRKGSGEARGEVGFRNRGQSRFTLALYARTEGDTIRLDLGGEGSLEPLLPWLPGALTQAGRTAPVDARAQLGLSPGNRATGRASARLGDLVAIEGTLSFQDKLLRFNELRGTADLAFAGSMAGLAGPVTGRAELADGEATWAPERGGWPEARATLRLLDAALPASTAGVDVLVRGIEARLALEPREGGASARGELRGEKIEAAGLELAPVATPLRVDLDAGGGVSRLELTALTAQVHGMPVRGTVAYDVARGRADARVEATAARLDTLARRLGVDWLGPSDQLSAGSIRVLVTALDPRGLSAGKVDAEVRGLTLRQPEGEANVERASLSATVRSGGAAIGFEVERVRGTLPRFEGLLARVEGSADVDRAGGSVGFARATVTARDGEGREMLQADLTRQGVGDTKPVRLTARVPALERLAPLWPSVPRQMTGSATVELEAPDLGFGTYGGRLGLQVATAELLDGHLSLRDLSADVPLRRGGTAAAAGGSGAGPGGPLRVGELVGYGVVLYDFTAQARAVDQRLTLADLHYGLYSGEGRGVIELEFAGDGPTARAQLRGERVRIEDFIAAYGIRGGTMTGLLRYDLDMRYGGGRRGATGRFEVPEGGTVTIELLDRLLAYTDADPTGVVKSALGNLRAFDYKAAEATVRTASDDIRVSLSLHGRERFGIFPPRVKEINVRDMPIGFLARQFPSL